MPRTFDDDQALLDGLLRDAVRASGDGEVLDVHDRAVELATAARGGDDAASDELAALVGGLDVRGAELLVRSLTRWFQLANLAEDNERIRRLQAREAANGDGPGPARWPTRSHAWQPRAPAPTSWASCWSRPRCGWC